MGSVGLAAGFRVIPGKPGIRSPGVVIDRVCADRNALGPSCDPRRFRRLNSRISGLRTIA
jgi:hypothetical protein